MFKWLFKKKGCAKHMNNKLEVIGIDHGWSMMKTISQVFVTGVKEITTTPALFGDVLEYEGKFYKVGTVRQEVKDTMAACNGGKEKADNQTEKQTESHSSVMSQEMIRTMDLMW